MKSFACCAGPSRESAIARDATCGSRPAVRALTGALRLYKVILSPLLPPACRYYPTCSDYAAGAIVRHGAARGSLLAARRLLRCNPFTLGGYDPVP